MGHASLLREGLCRHIFIIAFDTQSMHLTGWNEWEEEEDGCLQTYLRPLS